MNDLDILTNLDLSSSLEISLCEGIGFPLNTLKNDMVNSYSNLKENWQGGMIITFSVTFQSCNRTWQENDIA